MREDELGLGRVRPGPRDRLAYRKGLVTLAAAALALAAAAPVATAASRAAPQDAGGLDLSKYRGKVVYLDFWASWCGPCKLSFPFMQELQADYGPRGLVVVAVNVDHARDKADRFLSAFGANFPVVFDPRGALAARFKVEEMPTSILIGRDGRVRYVHQGFFPSQSGDYRLHVSELVDEK